MKRLLSWILIFLLVFSLTGCSEADIEAIVEIADVVIEATEEQTLPDETITVEEAAAEDSTENTAAAIAEDGWYYSAEDVSEYLYTYSCLPENFITKDEARALGWEGGSVEVYAPGYAIGGDRFGNREKILPEDHIYYECDIDTNGASSRGAKRIVFSEDGLIYYTEDHYETFTLLYGEE